METNQEQEPGIENKETFIIRSEWWDSISDLSEKGKAIFLEWLFCYHLNKPIENINDESNREVRIIWKLIAPNLRRNIEYYDQRRVTSKVNGKKGGRPINANNLNNLKEPKKSLSDIDTDIDTDNDTDIEIDNESENEKLKTLSHFDFLNLKFNKEVLKLVAEYKPKIIDWDFCIKKFNNEIYSRSITDIDLEKWLRREYEYDKKNLNNKNSTDQFKDPYKDKNGKIKCMSSDDKPKEKIGGF